jgi:Concanavalin A-like lectin/glucanases superfamily/Divergent InlB B-repeat domain/Putative Ig domain/Immunoglobulin I-set domain
MLKYSYDPSGNVTAQAVSGTVPPQITGQPVQQIVEPGQFATFSVVVVDTSGVTYQWRFNGAAIAGATHDSLIVTNAGPANQGQYTVAVTNSAGSVTSAPAALLLDSDRDGLPDSWETANFGNLTSQTSEGDPDHDGVSNLDEFLNGTNPLSSASERPRLVAYSGAGGSVTAAPTKLSYALGDTVRLTATAIAPSVFVGWAGDLSGTANPATMTMNVSKSIRARFASAVPLPPGMLAFWRGEVDASDLIGGHNGAFFSGTVVVGPSITPSGKVGKAFNFDGTVHVRVPDSPALRPAQVTLEAWVFPTLLSSSYQTIVARGSSTSDDDTWFLGILNGQAHFWTYPSNDVAAAVSIPLNQWTHLAASFDGSTKFLYINGAQVASQSGLGPLFYDPSPAVPVTIGSDWAFGTSSARFTGHIDEVSIYNRALTSNEIADISNADRLGKSVTQPYFTSSSQLPDAVLGASYSFKLTAVLGAAPLTFSSTGPLPPAISLSAAGVVSSSSPLGVAGIFDFTVRATDAAGKFSEQLCVLRVMRPIAPPADMVAWWRGEADASDLIGGHGGSFFSGTTVTGPSITPSGKVGKAFNFDGTVHVRVPDSPALRPAQVTLEAWVFPTLLSGIAQTVISRGSSTNENDTWFLGILNGQPHFFTWPSVDLTAAVSIPLNQWTHLAASFDGSTKRLYVNGAQVALQGGLGPLFYDPSPNIPVTVGSDWGFGASDDRFNGRVDEVCVYRRALSDAEVFNIVDAGSAGKSTAGPYIASASQLPFAIVGQPYSQAFTSVRGTAPVVFGLAPDSVLPAGLTLAAGAVRGTPTNSGSSSFTVRATDAAELFHDQACTLRIYKSATKPAGLIGWWKGEGNALDSGGGNHTGTPTSSVQYAPGEVGKSFLLNGTDSYVEIPDAPALRPQSLSIEAWVNLDSVVGTRVIFAKPVGAGTSDSFGLWLQNGFLSGAVGGPAGIVPVLGAPFSLLPNQWHHAAYTFDNSGHKHALYIDGAPVAGAAVTTSIGYDSQPLLLGRDTENGVPSFFLAGQIDEAAIYGRALSGSEIASIYLAGPAGKQ